MPIGKPRCWARFALIFACPSDVARVRPDDPYAHAPRLPDGAINPRALLASSPERVELEIGPGRGWFVLERLEELPDVGVIGLEIRRKWATIVDERLAKRGYGTRGRVFAEDARQVLPRFTDAAVDAVFIHFPDPWWKKRHKKRLVITRELVNELARVLVAGGELFIQTDVEERARAYADVVAQESRFGPWEAQPEVSDNPHAAKSPRERRAIADGLPVLRLRYRRLEPKNESEAAGGARGEGLRRPSRRA
jgi:tRNA (guanine-N7-)-methyltransferase